MKKEDLPQDRSGLEVFTREVCYVKNEDGKYEKALSSGWQVKNDALDGAWDEITRRCEEAKNAFLAGKKRLDGLYQPKGRIFECQYSQLWIVIEHCCNFTTNIS